MLFHLLFPTDLLHYIVIPVYLDKVFEIRVTQVVKHRFLDYKVHDFNQNVNTYNKARMSQQFKDCAVG